MLVLVAVPAFYVAALAHRLLQRYAPSNVLVRRARAVEPRWRAVAILAAVAAGTLIASHGVAGAVTAGAPRCLNVIVLALAWDAIKFAFLTVRVSTRVARRSILRLLQIRCWRL